MQEFLTITGAIALVKAIIDLVKYVRNGDVNGWVTQLAVWVAGVAVVVLYSHSDFTGPFNDVAGIDIGTTGWATLVILGLALGAQAMLVVDFKKAIDSGDSAAKPDLIKPSDGT